MIRFCLMFSFVFLLGLSSCESDSALRDNNSFLRNKRVNFSLNLSLPQFADLTFPGNDLFIRNESAFLQGVFIFTANAKDYTVFELAEPNHPEGSCSTPTQLTNGRLEYMCGEEPTAYDILGLKVDGTSQDFPLRRYSAIRNGNTLSITF